MVTERTIVKIDTKNGNKNIWLLGWSSFFNDVGSEMITPILPFLITGLGGAGVAVGALSGIREGLAAIFKLFGGWYSDRLGKRKFEFTSEDREPINQEIGIQEYRITRGEKDLNFFDSTDNCPVCENNLGKDKNKYIKKINDRISEAKNKLKKFKSQLKKIDNELFAQKNHNEKVSSIEQAIVLEKQKRKMNEDNLISFQKSLDAAEKKEFTLNLEDVKNSFETKKEEYKKVFKHTSNLQKEMIIHDAMGNILGTEGIKSHFFAKLIPVLNTKINEYLDLFNLPISLIFNEFMEEKICMYGNPLQEAPYLSFSAGEQKRIDIAILLSFIDTTKLISNWSSNVIIFDELLDGSSDANGMQKIMEAVQQLTIDDPHLCLYIISHRDLEINFNQKYTLKKVNGFSRLTKENT